MSTPETPMPAYDEPQDAQANVNGSLLHQEVEIRDEHPDAAATAAASTDANLDIDSPSENAVTPKQPESEHPDAVATAAVLPGSDETGSGQLEQAGSVDGHDPLDEELSNS